MQGVLGFEHMPPQVPEEQVQGMWGSQYASITAKGAGARSAWGPHKRRKSMCKECECTALFNMVNTFIVV